MIATKNITTFVFGFALSVGVALPVNAAYPSGMPKELRQLPSEVNDVAAEIQKIVNDQRGLIDKAQQAKTPEQREAVFQAVARNVQAIAHKRVVIMKHYTQHSQARADWARKHAAEVRLADLTSNPNGFVPRSPFVTEDESTAPETAPEVKSPAFKPLQETRKALKLTMLRLRNLNEELQKTSSDERRNEIKQEIEGHLKTIQQQRVVVLEAILEVSQKRLIGARLRAKQAGVGTETESESSN